MIAADHKNGRVTALWLVLWMVIAAAAFYGLDFVQEKQLAEMQLRIQQQFDAKSREAQNESHDLEQQLRRKAREAELRRRTELEAAWGGPIPASFKNPAYSLR